MSKKQFWIRLGIYILFGLLAPAGFMIWRFRLFQKISSIQIGGWGIVLILFVTFFIIKLARAVKKGLPFSYWTQVINGFMKVTLPLIALTLIIYISQNNIKEILQLLYVAIPLETIAYCVNPIPVWSHENHLEEDGVNLSKILKAAGLTKEDGGLKK